MLIHCQYLNITSGRGQHTESKNLLDGVVVGNEHDHAVNAHTPSTSWWKTVLKRGAEVLINELSLVVTLVLLPSLLLETHTLVEGIVQLGVGVANLLLADESLETLAESGEVTVVLGERRHHLGVASDEGWVDAGILDPLADELVEHAGVGEWGRALNVVLLQQRLEELASLLGVELGSWWELLARDTLELSDHVHTPPWLSPVDLVLLATVGVALGKGLEVVLATGVEDCCVAASNLLDHSTDQVLSDLDEIMVVRVRPVELASRELGVVCKIDTLVTELPSNLVYTLQATDNQHLQVELGSYTHVELHVELVVVCNERLRCGSSGNGVHHGGLNLDEVPLVKVLADEGDNLATGDEGIAGLVVHDKIEVPLSVPSLLVLKAIVLSRQHVQAGSQELDICGENTKLSNGAVLGVRPAGETDDANDISTLKLAVFSLVVALAELVLSNDLDLCAIGEDDIELEVLAGGADSLDTASNTDLDVLLLLAVAESLPLLNDFRNLVLDVELVGVWVWCLGCAKLVDSLGPHLEVLLKRQSAQLNSRK